MATVAIVAVALAATRVESAPSAAIAIIGVCISCLTHQRYSEDVASRQAKGLTTSTSQKAGLLWSSVTIATAIIGLSDLAFLTGYYDYLGIIDKILVRSHWTPYLDPGHMITGVIIGAYLALCVASWLGQTVWTRNRPEPWPARRWLKLWPVGISIVIGSLLVADYMYERYSFCRMMAEYHAGAKAKAKAKADGLKKAALHAWLKQWYERAAIRPWLPVHPVRLPPGME